MLKNKYVIVLVILIVSYYLFLRPNISSSNKPGYNSSTPAIAQPTQSSSKKIITVKYRNDPVNLNSGDFEYSPTSSSFVNGLWYDQSNQYMIILLNNTYYHYCGLSISEWRSFKSADSFGTYYNQRIKGNYDCRQGHVPSY